MSDAAVNIDEAPPRSVAGFGIHSDDAGVRAALQAHFSAKMPAPCRFVRGGCVTLSCTAPRRFVASGPRDANLSARLIERLAGSAAVTDQSDMWAVFVVSGAAVREVLARIVPVDLGREQFGIGHLALTRAGHLDVRLWRVADTTFEIAATRSYAADLSYALHASR